MYQGSYCLDKCSLVCISFVSIDSCLRVASGHCSHLHLFAQPLLWSNAHTCRRSRVTRWWSAGKVLEFYFSDFQKLMVLLLSKLLYPVLTSFLSFFLFAKCQQRLDKLVLFFLEGIAKGLSVGRVRKGVVQVFWSWFLWNDYKQSDLF